MRLIMGIESKLAKQRVESADCFFLCDVKTIRDKSEMVPLLSFE